MAGGSFQQLSKILVEVLAFYYYYPMIVMATVSCASSSSRHDLAYRFAALAPKLRVPLLAESVAATAAKDN